MLGFIYGGSGSGKSVYAENLAVRLSDGPLYYLATMVNCDGECTERIARHRRQRQEKGFQTIEQAYDLTACVVTTKSTVLLECLSNLLSNECYRSDAVCHPQQKVWEDLQYLKNQCDHLLVVSNDVFADGYIYDAETNAYMQMLGWLHRQLAQEADFVCEVVVGLPLIHKGDLL